MNVVYLMQHEYLNLKEAPKVTIVTICLFLTQITTFHQINIRSTFVKLLSAIAWIEGIDVLFFPQKGCGGESYFKPACNVNIDPIPIATPVLVPICSTWLHFTRT